MEYPSTIPGKELLKEANIYRTIYFFGGAYHLIKDRVLTEISNDEAENLLRTENLMLWNIGSPIPGKFPDTCPEVLCVSFSVEGLTVPEFLQHLFNLKFMDEINVTNN